MKGTVTSIRLTLHGWDNSMIWQVSIVAISTDHALALYREVVSVKGTPSPETAPKIK